MAGERLAEECDTATKGLHASSTARATPTVTIFPSRWPEEYLSSNRKDLKVYGWFALVAF